MNKIPSVKPFNIHKWEKGTSIETEDLLAAEEPLEIILEYGPKSRRESSQLSITMRTPGHDIPLVRGFLFGENIIPDQPDIKIFHCQNVKKKEEKGNVVKVVFPEGKSPSLEGIDRNFYVNSSCGVCGKTSIDKLAIQACFPLENPEITTSAAIIAGMGNKIRNEQTIFKYTGGLHAAALFSPQGELLCLFEDIGRHNAVDKVIGHGINNPNINFRKSILFVSGRAGFELVQKCIKAKIPIMAAVGAPSSLAVDLALNYQLCLAGFVKSDKLNIYSKPALISTD